MLDLVCLGITGIPQSTFSSLRAGAQGPTANVHWREPLQSSTHQVAGDNSLFYLYLMETHLIQGAFWVYMFYLFFPCPVSLLMAFKYLQCKHHFTSYLSNSEFSNTEI